jgi:hypothetical protein
MNDVRKTWERRLPICNTLPSVPAALQHKGSKISKVNLLPVGQRNNLEASEALERYDVMYE